MDKSTTTIAFVDDHPVLLRGVADLFEQRPVFEIAGLGTSASDALELTIAQAPAVLLVDLSMPGDVFGTIADITHNHISTRIIVFTAFASVDSALRAIEAGAMGFVLKGSTCDELFEAVSTVMRGEMFITRQFASQVLSGLHQRERTEELRQAVRLSMREKQIVAHLMHARTNREIADSLCLSEKTVKFYMTGLMAKLKARNRLEVVLEAQKSGALN